MRIYSMRAQQEGKNPVHLTVVTTVNSVGVGSGVELYIEKEIASDSASALMVRDLASKWCKKNGYTLCSPTVYRLEE